MAPQTNRSPASSANYNKNSTPVLINTPTKIRSAPSSSAPSASYVSQSEPSLGIQGFFGKIFQDNGGVGLGTGGREGYR